MSKIIFIGDSRTVGMEQSVPQNNNLWSCKSSMGLDWMKSTGVPNIEGRIESGDVIVILMGINDMLLRPASQYCEYVNEKSIEWQAKGASTCYVTINPVEEEKYKANYNGSYIPNAKIQAYNKDLQSGLASNVNWIDCYSHMISSFETFDGLHYVASTYQDIYNFILSCIESGDFSSSVPTGNITIDYTKLKPFVAILDRHSGTPKFDKLKEAGVIGVIIEAGYLYDTSHKELETFRPLSCYKQASAAVEAELDYGFYYISRATTRLEADKEIDEIQMIIAKYHPTFGVWIVPDYHTKNQKTIDSIISRQYDLLERLGLSARMGFYATEKQLKKLSWDKNQKKWLLMIVDHIDEVTELDALLDPMFFDMEGRY